jgi:xanthosine phosphorylase
MIDINKEISFAEQAAEIIKKKTNNFVPKIAIVLGSGLGPVAAAIKNPISIPYRELPYFQTSDVVGHAHKLSFGMLEGVPVVCLEGRVHPYEGGDALLIIRNIIRTLKLIGVEVLFTTNAVGSLRKEVGVGELVAITDQINFTSVNPLTGIPDNKMSSRFVSMDDAYDAALRKKLHAVAKAIAVPLHDGVYLASSGPTFETHAEIRMFKAWGADTVGMSTVPETIVARAVGIKVLSVSMITNLAAGLSDEKLSHEGTLKGAAIGIEKLIKLIVAFLQDFAKK